ncbi:N-ethylmaleimide reductase [Pseudidiomarina salinarum]|uniref:N-ethylmaleimide reductase n=1 Tax=Pseudidiomarina salinarum TaxID=435908 RepID=A0A094L867_9GAMM|nr:alkene reductase [Pseudidiomarina salinarum]KFZ30993.1 N-ethylmaleimide reductase [Pseudidiomarina salinarum]RUO71477.1 alkene reductase [Pseudidiomarina salinarum]
MTVEVPDDPLFQPLQFGTLKLRNRIIMAPLTRSRASQPGDVPTEMNARYYRQRASAGFIIAEATQVSPQGKGYAFTPGIHSQEQIEGWRKVTDAVHAAGGRIYLQLWHVGRISHPDLQPDGQQPVAPSAIQPKGAQTYTSKDSGMVDIPEPRALKTEEIPDIVEQFRQGAKNARDAGFDGVELHAANGYLLDQFLRSGSNERTDKYGGSVENRLRLPLEVVEAVVDVWGKENVGIRVSPTGSFNDMKDDDPVATYGLLAKRLDDLGISFIEVVEDSFQGNHADDRPEDVIMAIQTGFKGVYIANGEYDAKEARQRITEGRCDLVSFGRPFIANPDLPRRFRENAELNDWDSDTFYGGDERGYTDYPSLDEQDPLARPS